MSRARLRREVSLSMVLPLRAKEAERIACPPGYDANGRMQILG